MDDKEIRLRILESAMKYIHGAGSEGVLNICRDFESYVLSDKVSVEESPVDDVKEHRLRKRNKAKDAPSNF